MNDLNNRIIGQLLSQLVVTHNFSFTRIKQKKENFMIKDETNTNNLDKAMPNRNLTVKIVGLALFQISDGKPWKLSFPKAKDHTFKIVIDKFDANGDTFTSEFILLAASDIEFVPDSKRGPSKAHKTLNDIICFGKYHNTNGNPLPLTTTQDKYAGVLSLKGTELFGETFKPTDLMDFSVWKVEELDPVTFKRTRVEEKISIGNNLSAGFMVEAKDFTVINVKGGLAFTLNLPYEEDGSPVTYTITFYNDCGNVSDCKHVGDMGYYYDILQPSDKLQFEFVPHSSLRTKNGGCTPACNC
jgi:hypothetical protein